MTPLRTVLADDDEGMRLLLGLTLDNDPRFTVVGAAADGDEALELVATEHPDLLVLDMEMPRRNGLGVLEELTDEGPTVVVLSAVGTPALIAQALDLGAVAFLDKGAVARTLGDAIHAAATGGGDS